MMTTTLQNPASLHHQEQIVCPLLGGEVAKETYKDLTYLCPYSSPGAIKGTLVLTNFKIYFKSYEPVGGAAGADEDDCSGDTFPTILDVPLGFVSRVEKMGGHRTSGDKAYGLEIVCKDIRVLRFALNKLDTTNPARNDIFEKLRMFCFPKNKFPLFAFEYKDRYPESCNGWKVYDATREFQRQKVIPIKKEGDQKKTNISSWRETKVNNQWKLCDTYPQILFVPSEVTDQQLIEVGKFRSKARIPVLSWMHPESQATICRCSQPMVGVANAQSKADEEMVQHIMGANAGSHRISIMDARPKVNAMANIVNGGGYEDDNIYDNVDFEFLDIQNIHVMRESLRRVKEVCFPVIDERKWITNVDNTQWKQHLRCVLRGAVKIVNKVQLNSTSVIVHCSDGWDRTSQLVALAMMLLDPYYRTLEGFEVLIEKEWLSMGHKFSQRVGHGEDKHNGNDRSPVFLQFIDCAWQVMGQFPHCFEFNENFLKFILDHLYSCLFGTFLYNSDKERTLNRVREETQSLWSFVNFERKLFLNQSYRGMDYVRVILPETEMKYLKLWTGYFCRWNPIMGNQDTVNIRKNNSRITAINDNLKSKLAVLKKELDSKRKSSLPQAKETGDHTNVNSTTNVDSRDHPTSPTSSTQSSATSSSGSAKPPSTSPPSLYYSNLSSASSSVPPPLPSRAAPPITRRSQSPQSSSHQAVNI